MILFRKEMKRVYVKVQLCPWSRVSKPEMLGRNYKIQSNVNLESQHETIGQ